MTQVKTVTLNIYGKGKSIRPQIQTFAQNKWQRNDCRGGVVCALGNASRTSHSTGIWNSVP